MNWQKLTASLGFDSELSELRRDWAFSLPVPHRPKAEGTLKQGYKAVNWQGIETVCIECVVLLHFGFGERQGANLDVTDDLFLIW